MIYKRGKHGRKTFTYVHTNLERRTFRIDDVGTLYRLRWQIELLFKEYKSHANLHRPGEIGHLVASLPGCAHSYSPL